MAFRKKNHKFLPLIAILFIFSVLSGLFLGNKFFKTQQTAQGASNVQESYKKEAEKIARYCEFKQKEDCYSKQFKELTQKNNLAFAKETLNILQDLDPQHARGCHLIAHYITIAETKKDLSKWKELLKQVDSNSCSGGYVHGILEAHMASMPNYKITPSEVPKICSLLPDADAGGDINCSHNLGHIILAQEKNNIEKGVDICDAVTGDKMKYECLSGIFMERMTRLNLEAHGISTRVPWNRENTAEMERICRQFDGTPGLSCWREISHMFSVLHGVVPDKVFDACYRAPRQEFGDDCYLHAASIMIVSSKFNNQNLNKVCTKYSYENTLYDKCMDYVIGGLFNSSEKFSPKVIQLCNASTGAYVEKCYQKMGRILSQIISSEDKRKDICTQVQPKFRSLCIASKVDEEI